MFLLKKEIIIQTSSFGKMYYTCQDKELNLFGECLIRDVIYASDFVRALVISPCDERMSMTSCMITTHDVMVIFTRLYKKDGYIFSITKHHFLSILDVLEDALQKKSFPLTLEIMTAEYVCTANYTHESIAHL